MKVLTAVVNNPIFIEIQYNTLKKYMKCDYEFIIFNDAKDFPDFTNGNDISIKKLIEDTCKKFNIKCINIPNEHHKLIKCAMQRCADSMNYILKYQIENKDEYLIIDSDMFLIDYFDNDYKKFDCAIVLQSRNNHNTNYFWNGLYYFNMNKMNSIDKLDWNPINNCDVGGMMEKWLKSQTKNIPNVDNIRHTIKNYDADNIHYIRHLWSCTWNEDELPDNLKDNKKLLDFLKTDSRNQNNKFYTEIYDNKFLHYRAGGNWSFQNNYIDGMKLHYFLANKLKNTLC
jgi:hypothetical protein